MAPADLGIAWRFSSQLPAFLRRRVDAHAAAEVLRQRLANRADDFLRMLRDDIYADPDSPYVGLLRHAGCEYGDVEQLVRRDGVEGTLQALYRNGVYLTGNELKGRQPARRGSATLAIDPERLRNRRSAFHVPVRSGASRGPGLPILVDFAALEELAVNFHLALVARGGTDWVKSVWAAPGGSVVSSSLLMAISFGVPPDRCFLYVDPRAPGLHPRYRWSLRLMRWTGWLAGMRFRRPLLVPVHAAMPVARWMADVIRSGRTPYLAAHPSAAARVCEIAEENGLDLRGARFSLRGEPITSGRLAGVRRAGAEAIPLYGTIECGTIGNGCATPQAADEVHLLDDLHAVIQCDSAAATDLPPGALLITSLRPTARLTLLNVSTGDVAAMDRRACGCPLERLGWKTHVHAIRSFEKLTAGGMTFLGTNVVRVLEEVLPARFGGSALDYQLIEEEGANGRPRLRLVVGSRIGPIDGRAVADVFLGAIGSGSGVEHVMELVWRDAGFLQVERGALQTTAAGKVLHLHSNRSAAEPADQQPE